MHTHMHLHEKKKEGTMKSLACFMVELITITLTVLRSPIPRDKLMWVWRQEERQIYVTRAPTSHFSRKTALLSSILFVTCTPTPPRSFVSMVIFAHTYQWVRISVHTPCCKLTRICLSKSLFVWFLWPGSIKC